MASIRLLVASILLLHLPVVSVAAAQTNNDSLLSLERIFLKPYIAGTRPTDPQISPDGKLMLFRWDAKAENKYRYWMMNSDGSNMKMINDTLVNEVEWSPDSKTVACVRKGDVFLTDTSFQSYRRITKTEASESGLQWSPDGKLLAFNSESKLMASPVTEAGFFELAKSSSKDESVNLLQFSADSKHILVAASSREGLQEFIVPRYTGKEVSTTSFKGGVSKVKIGFAPVDTGSTVWAKLPGEERFFLGDAAISPDGKQIFVERYSSNRKKREIFVADTDSGKAKLVFEEKDDAWIEGGLYTTRWMPDGKQIVTTTEKEGWNHLYMMAPDGKGMRKLTDGAWEIRWFDVAPQGDKIYFLANKEEHAQWQLYSIDVQTKSITRLSERQGTYESPNMSKDGSLIVAKYSDFGAPPELEGISTSKVTSEHQLTNSVPGEFKKIQWVIPEIDHFKSKDGTSIPVMICKPKDFNPSKKYPVVVFVHGAGYLQNVFRGWSYYYREYLFHHRLTQRGYIVFEVEYRGSAGLGRKFRTDVSMYLGGKDLQDELDGLEYLKSLGYIDPQRVGIYGGSYGGFMALMGLFLSDKYACGAALRAVTSWENYYRHNSWYTEARLGKPEDNPEAYKKSSPITFADSLKKPLLILHGMVDDNVFFQDAVQLIGKLQKAKKKFEVMIYPDEPHSFTEPESWYDEYSRIEEFFDKHLK